MNAATAQSELRLGAMLDEREQTQKLHEELLSRIGTTDVPDEVQKEQIKMYREKAQSLDVEIETLSEAVESDRRAAEASKKIRRALAGSAPGVDVDEEGVMYRSMAAYARDVILSRDSQICSKIAKQFGDDQAVQGARERLSMLKRTANTLSGNVGGLQPPQFIDQIFQVIDSSRPIVASATRTTLERGTLTFPKISQRPVVAVQVTEKTEGGAQAMHVDMVQTVASTYLGGGDLSWQAINWSTPDALDLWFQLAAADYALKTETDAAQILEDAASNHIIADQLAGSPADTFGDWLTALTEGAALVYANSGRLSDTIYVAPNLFYLAAAITSAAFAQLGTGGRLNIGTQNGDIAGMNVIVSRGLHAGCAIVGDSKALIVAETADAPVELRVVEPAIGGVEVGIIGAFEAVVAEDTAFALVGPNS